MKDNITEHPTTINIFERMNIYQEVVLAAIYKSFPVIQVRTVLSLEKMALNGAYLQVT